MIYFTSDTHFGHSAIIKMCNRPFQTLDEMDNTLIRNWNSVVTPTDTVWHLGDFAWKDHKYYLSQLNGKINLILGNHDKGIKKITHLFNSIQEGHFLKLSHLNKNYQIYLHHYSCRVWPSKHYGSYHLYGHSHGTLPSLEKSFDIGVDPNNYIPLSLDQVLEKFKNL